MLEGFDVWIAQVDGSVWLLPLVLLLTAVDGVIPPVPSETLIAALGAVGASTGQPPLLALGLAAAAGAWLGDNTAYLIGRTTPLARLRDSSRASVQRVVRLASRELQSHSGSILITARFVPVGRVAVNMSAGLTGFPWRRFVRFSAVASVLWAGYVVGIGALAGAWVTDNSLLAAGLAVAIALVLGVVLDRFRRWWHRHDVPAAAR